MLFPGKSSILWAQSFEYRRDFHGTGNQSARRREETGILTLTDENGQDANFEYLDCIEYQDTEYLVLMPEGEDEIVILEVEPVDEDNENYLAVEDEETLNAVYEIFKEKFKDVLTFEE